jgi:hypothetical protein
VGFTVFHDSTMPPDDFIANCKISLSELIEKEDQPTHEVWVTGHFILAKLEPLPSVGTT